MTQGEHILVCLSSSPANGTIIRAAAGWRRPLRGNLQRCMWKLPNPRKWTRRTGAGFGGISVWQRSWEPRSKPPAGTTLRSDI